jgi:hypothetical protein
MKLSQNQQSRVTDILGRYAAVVGFIASDGDESGAKKFVGEMYDKFPNDQDTGDTTEQWRLILIRQAKHCLARLEEGK